MMFFIAVLATVGVIGFFHYIQGFFSATISAVLAAVSALLALSLYEPAVKLLLGGKFASTAHGMMLLVLFALFYLILRTVFDKLVPGNVRVPALVDKVGGAAMGVVAGIFAAGIAAIAAQTFPLMPDVAGYTKYAVGGENREVTVPAVGRHSHALNLPMLDEVDSDMPGKFDESKRTPVSILPVDDIVVGMLKQHSTIGALSASNPLTNFHPDLLQEYFGQRLGIETGAPRVVVHNLSKQLEAIRAVELYRLDGLPPQVSDYGYPAMRPPEWKKSPPDKKLADELKKNPKLMLLVARVRLGKAASTDKKALLRLSPGSVRLVAGRTNPATAEMEPANYFPVGTIDNARNLVVNRIDDFLFINTGEDRAIDFAFIVEREGLVGKSSGAAPPKPAAGATAPTAAAASVAMTVEPGVFFELNRMGTFQLEGAEVSPPSKYKEDKTVQVIRQIPEPQPQAVPQEAPQPAPQAPPPPTVPLRDKLVGTWTGMLGDKALEMTFNGDGSVAYTFGTDPPGAGKWTSQGEVNTTTLNITRQLGTGAEETTTVTFNGDDAITLNTPNKATVSLTRKK